jgi:elongation factor G
MLWNTQAEADERIGHLLAMQGKQGKEIPKLVTGDIGGVAKLKTAHSGQSLCAKAGPVKLAWIQIREPAISCAIEPRSKGDEEKIGEAIHRLMEEDPSLRAHRDPETAEFLLSGTGQLHVEITVAKLKQRFGVEVILHPPKVPYRETIRRKAPGHGRHKKQTGVELRPELGGSRRSPRPHAPATRRSPGAVRNLCATPGGGFGLAQSR